MALRWRSVRGGRKRSRGGRERSYGAGMQVRLFGELQAVSGGVAVAIRGVKQRTLLAVLALAQGEPVSADRLIDVLWGDGLVTNPANALQAQIGQLRRTLGPAAIATTEAGYALDVAPDDVDVVHFAQLVRTGRRLANDGDAAQASSVLNAALALRRGEPLAEFTYADFADADRARLLEVTIEAVEARAGADLALGRDAELVGELEDWCRRHPLRERLCELLMMALYRAGRQAEALRAYTSARDRLVDQLGIDPGPALRDLEARVLVQDPSLMLPRPAELPAAAPVPALPAPRALGNLSARLSRFVGRDAELRQLQEAVRGSRLVTLVGPGGVGKTRLGVEAAAALREHYPDGAWLVELAGVADPDGVAPAVAAALGAAATASTERVAGPAMDLIMRHLAGRSAVIVLDNCEHVVGEAAALAHALVTALPGVLLIATSREPLGVPGEVLLPMGGLPSPVAVELFVDRARAVRPGFTADEHTGPVIEDICRRLDGLPLAVELAAARLRALALATVTQRLDDRFRLLTGGARTALPRQQTLRAVVDWSYDLLFEDERHLFVRLAVFVGGCELEAAEAVCADEHVPRAEVLDVLSRLVDKSLVNVPDAGTESRFTQLQTLCQYGRDRLTESGDAEAIRARHASYYRQLAHDAPEGLRGATGSIWRARVAAELGNMRAAIDWYVAIGDADAAASMASGMAWLWFINTDFAEGARWLGDALGATRPRRPDLGATAHAWHGYFGGMSANAAEGACECEDAVATLRTIGDPARLAEALVLCATVLARAGEFNRSLDLLGEARDLLEPAGHRWILAISDLTLAWNLAALGQLEDAEAAARASIERFDVQEEVLLGASSLNALAHIAAARGDLDSAAAAYEELLRHCRATGQHHHEPVSLLALAALRSRRGDDVGADGLYREAIAFGLDPWQSVEAMVGQAGAARRLGDLIRARSLLDAAASHCRLLDIPASQVTVLAGLAWWALAAGHPADATVFAADAVHLAAVCGDPAIKVLSESAAAAVAAVADPTRHTITRFVALAHQRADGQVHRSLIDGRDVAALAVHLSRTSAPEQPAAAP